jgi:hypothetical protein
MEDRSIAYYRRRIEELLPWALVGASHVSRFENDDIGTAAPIGDRVYPLTKSKAAAVVERINNGEFTEEQ